MRQEPDFFDDRDLPLLFIAKRLKEALRIEQLLTDAKINYLVETDSYKGGIIFVTERVGAFFYVDDEQVEQARDLLIAQGYKPYKPE